MTPSRQTYKVIFAECDHHPLFTINPPAKGQYMLCFVCRRTRTVIDIMIRCWYWKCVKCNRMNTSGQRKKEAIERGTKHATKFGHVVEVHRPDNGLDSRIVPFGEQLELPGFPDD